ncbi:fungal-specific transcription factor domain-containing protein [Aspergillus heterothallicus]
MTGKDHTPRNATTPKRTKTGCQPCRRRKKKCDELRPTCSGCARNNLACQWASEAPSSDLPQRRQRIKRRDQRIKGPQLVPGLLGMITVFAVPSLALLDRLLSHFTDYGPLWLSVGPGQRRTCFLGHLVPMALQKPLVLNCIFAVAATDLAKYNSVERELDIVALEMQSKAITELNDAISKEISSDHSVQRDLCSSDELLLAVLLLCLHEAQNFSDNSKLLIHVNAAATLCCRSLQQQPTNPELREFLFGLFCYFFSLAAFSHGTNMLKEPAANVFEYQLAQSSPQRPDEDVLFFGPGERMFWTIFRVSTIASQQPLSKSEDDVRRMELSALETELHHQTINFNTSPENRLPSTLYKVNTNHTSSNSHEQTQYTDHERARDKSTVFELYRLACILYIKRTLDPHDIPLPHSDRDLQDLVASFITHLDVLPESSFANGILCWPLVVVGLCALNPAHQRAILARLRIMHRTWRTDIFSQNIEFLRAHWEAGRRVRHLSCSSTSSSSGQFCGHSSCQDAASSLHFSLQSLAIPAILV